MRDQLANFLPDDGGDDDAEKQRLAAWADLAGRNDGVNERVHEVQLPQVDVTADNTRPVANMTAADFGGNDAAPTPPAPIPTSELPADAPAVAKLGQALSQPSAAKASPYAMDAPAPPANLPPDKPKSEGGGGLFGTGNQASPWALLADIALNHGRGVGGILALGGSGEHEKTQAEIDLKRAQAEKLQRDATSGGKTVDPAVLALRQEALDLHRKALEDAKAREEARNKGKLDEMDPNSAQAVAMRGLLDPEGKDERLQGLGTKGIQALHSEIGKLFTHRIAPQLNQDAADKATGVDVAKGEVRDMRASNEAANGALKAGAESSATLPDKIKIAEAGQALKDNSGTQKRADEKEARAAADQFSKETSYPVNILNNVNRIEQVVSKYKPGTIPGVGQGAGRTPDAWLQYRAGQGDPEALDAMEIRNAKSTMGELAQRKESGAAGPEAERFRYMARVGAADGASEEQFKLGLQATKKLSEMEVRRFASGKGDAAREVLKVNGLEHLLDDAGSQPSAAVAPPPALPPVEQLGQALTAPQPAPGVPVAKGDYANYSHDTSDPNRVGVVPVPKLQQGDVRAEKRPYQVTKPNGKTITEELSPAEAEVVRHSAGWSIQ